MLTARDTALRNKEFFVPPESPPEERAPEFTVEAAVAAIKAGDTVSGRIAELEAQKQASVERFREATASHQSEMQRLADDIRETHRSSEVARNARSFLLRDSEPSEEEIAAMERGRQLQLEAARLMAMYNLSADRPMAPPAESKQAKALEEVRERIRNTNPLSPTFPDPTGEERDLARYETLYGHWQKYVRVKEQSAEAYAERDRMRAEREQAVLDAAVKSIK